MKNSLSLKLEGSLQGPWVDELQKAWSASALELPEKPVLVNLAGVSFMDERGRSLLLQMKQAGAILQGASLFLRHVLDGEAGKLPKSEKN